MAAQKRLQLLGLLVLAGYFAAFVLAPWNPSTKLNVGFSDYLFESVNGEFALFRNPAAVALIVVCAGLSQFPWTPLIAGAAYGLLYGTQNLGVWYGTGVSAAHGALGVIAVGFRLVSMASLAALFANLVTTAFPPLQALFASAPVDEPSPKPRAAPSPSRPQPGAPKQATSKLTPAQAPARPSVSPRNPRRSA